MNLGDADAATQYVAERLLLTAREDLGRADIKASILLSGAVAVPALGFDKGMPFDSSVPGLVLFIVGGALWSGGALLLLAVIMPRTRTVRSVPGPTFYADALSVTDPEELRLATASAGRDRVGWLLAQFQDASVILAAKYCWLRRSMALLGAGLLLVVLTPLAG